MADTGTYLLIVGIGLVLTLVVGQILMRSGRGFLTDVFADEEVARSTTRLLGVLFHLVALGFLALISTFDPVPVEGVAQMVVTKLGVILLVLGALHGGTLLLLSRIRTRRREQGLEQSISAQYDQARQQRRQGSRTQVIEAGNTGTTGTPRS